MSERKVLNSKLLPLVSIVIPTYNHANFLGKALKSLLDQTYKNWEALVIDNKSFALMNYLRGTHLH